MTKQQARPIEELTAAFEQGGTQGLNVACSQELHFTAEEWRAMPEEEKERTLHNYRLAFRADTMVNWCPKLGTVLANDEGPDGGSVGGEYFEFARRILYVEEDLGPLRTAGPVCAGLRQEVKAEEGPRAQQAAKAAGAAGPDQILDGLFHPVEGAAQNEQDVGGIDLDEFLLRMLAASARRHVGHGALENFQQCLLHALAADIAGNRGILAAAGGSRCLCRLPLPTRRR